MAAHHRTCDIGSRAISITLKPLAEQVILITGASSGIGLVTARSAAARGARVMLVARGEDALRDAVAAIEAAGGTAGYAVADVGVLAEVEAAAAKTVARFGRIDTWVNNAGVAIYAKLVETPLDEHQRLFRTNYFGAVNGCVTAVRHLRGAGGALITVASIVSDIPSPIMGAYAASKHAVKGYVESLRIELKADRPEIAVTLIKPSGIDTPIAQHAANHQDAEAVVPPPVYDPQLVADAIVDAAVNVRRDVTVGGAGRTQVLLGTHFPAILERLGPLLQPVLKDRDQPKTLSNNLFAPALVGRERSGVNPGRRRTSLYTAAARNPLALAAIGLSSIGVFLALSGSRRSLSSVRTTLPVDGQEQDAGARVVH